MDSHSGVTSACDLPEMAPTVPPEIIAHILEFIDVSRDRGTISAFSFASSTFRHIAQPLLFHHIDLSTNHQARSLMSIIAENPNLPAYVRSIALCLPLLDSERSALSTTSIGPLHRTSTAQALDMLTNLRVLSLQFSGLVERSYRGSWDMIPADIRLALTGLMDGSSPARIEELIINGAQDFPLGLLCSSSSLHTLSACDSSIGWGRHPETMSPCVPIRIQTMCLSEGASSIMRALATHVPEALSELKSLEFFIDQDWDPDSAGTTAVLDACAGSLSHLSVLWASYTHNRTTVEALHVNKPLRDLSSLLLYLPVINLNWDPDNMDSGYLSADTTLQCLLRSLAAASSASALSDITIYLPMVRTTHHGSKGGGTLSQSHCLKPLSPEIQRLWNAIDTTLSAARSFASLKTIYLVTPLDFIDWLEPEEIGDQNKFAGTVECAERDLEPLESYQELAHHADRRRAAGLVVRAEELLPLTSKIVQVEQKSWVHFEQRPVNDYDYY